MKHQLELILTDDERGRKFKDFADSLERRYPWIEIHRKTEGDPGEPALLMAPHIRLGAMVTFEYLLEQDRSLGNNVLELLWKRFDRLDEGLKGDVLHLFGQAGGQKIIGYLGTILQGAYSRDVQEAAEEALQSILAQEV